MSECTPQEVRMFRIDYRCDACGGSHMVVVRKLRGATTKKYIHRCHRCGVEEILDVRYPRMVTRPVAEHAAEDVEITP